jgi:hypothetical protein
MMWITECEVERENRMALVRTLFFILFTVLTCTLIASASAQPPIPTPPLPPIFTDLNITPEEIEVGNEVTISFTITSSDNRTFTYTAIMQIGEWNFLIDVELGAYESKTVSRTITKYIPGDYKVTIESLEGSFTVKLHDIPPPPLPPFLSNLTITPDEIERGDNVTISFDIENYGSQSINYGVDMHIENVNDPPPTWPPYNVTLRIWVDLGAYEFKTVSQNITLDTVGDFNVMVKRMTGSFKVGIWPPEPPLRPAELVLSDLFITPETVALWEGVNFWTFKITVNVTNIGEQEGMDTIGLRVNGSIVDWRTVKLRGGESTPIIFDVTRGPGFYTVEVDGLNGSFVVLMTLKPAEFVVSDLFASPEVEEGEKVTFSVKVTNIGESEGTYTVEFKVDGETIETENVTLARGDSTTVSFEETWSVGTYQVNVEDLTKIFIVFTPEPPFWTSPEFVMVVSVIIAAAVILYAYWKGILPSATTRSNSHGT